MRRTFLTVVLLSLCLIVLATAQPDPQTALWRALKKQLSGSKGEQYFEANVKGTALPPLKGTLMSALINEGVSRAVLKMPGSEEPDVTLVVHNGSAKLKDKPTPGINIEFAGVAGMFSTDPFMLTFDVDIGNLRGLVFEERGTKRGSRNE